VPAADDEDHRGEHEPPQRKAQGALSARRCTGLGCPTWQTRG
jgi:hypothetical protein